MTKLELFIFKICIQKSVKTLNNFVLFIKMILLFCYK
ncbi:hypothetical protein bas61_0108 [Escherichia phage EmilieFrey]|nr:hypothetical protein bas61_0108 [Escherichia phage EmilieFrey]QXV83847.1 hypothetical protein bas60_0112 [Escherichia phage PaulScherrer]